MMGSTWGQDDAICPRLGEIRIQLRVCGHDSRYRYYSAKSVGVDVETTIGWGADVRANPTKCRSKLSS